MRKFLTLIFVFTLFSSLWGNVLKKYYFKDYGYITRIVFVFDKKPTFFISKNQTSFVINLNKVKTKTKNFNFKNNKVLKSLKINKDEKLSVRIEAKKKFNAKYFTFYDNGYKLVVDFFYTKAPVSIDELKSFAHFYSAIGYKKKAKFYLEKIREYQKLNMAPNDSIKKTKINKKIKTVHKNNLLKTESDSAYLTVSNNLIVKKNKSKNTISPFEDKVVKTPPKIKIPYMIWVIGIGFLVFIVIIILPQKKGKTTNESEKTGIWDKDFDENLVVMLLKKGWKIPEISREVNLDEKTIKKIKRRNRTILKRDK